MRAVAESGSAHAARAPRRGARRSHGRRALSIVGRARPAAGRAQGSASGGACPRSKGGLRAAPATTRLRELEGAHDRRRSFSVQTRAAACRIARREQGARERSGGRDRSYFALHRCSRSTGRGGGGSSRRRRDPRKVEARAPDDERSPSLLRGSRRSHLVSEPLVQPAPTRPPVRAESRPTSPAGCGGAAVIAGSPGAQRRRVGRDDLGAPSRARKGQPATTPWLAGRRRAEEREPSRPDSLLGAKRLP